MPQSVKHNLLAAFRHLLRPLIRIAIRNGVMVSEFIEVVQDAYVNVAASELRAAQSPVSPDAIFVMTEVESSKAAEILDSPPGIKLEEADQRINAAARVLVGWHTDREYIGPYGLVRDLAFGRTGSPSKKEVTGFIDLAEHYCPGISPKIVLDELVRTGCVQALGNGYYRAVTRSYVPEQLSAESLRRFAQVIHNVIETLEVNLRREVRGTGRIERTVFADFGLPRSDLNAFDRYVRERGQLFADDIDNWLADRSLEGVSDVVQTGIGFYHYIVNNDDERDFGNALKVEVSSNAKKY